MWKTTVIEVVLGFSRSLRLQVLWAAPRYFPVMWQWSRTESPLRGLSHTWHVSAVWRACQSSRVILMALGSASTPLILRSFSCSDSKKCSATLGPRYSTGGCLCFYLLLASPPVQLSGRSHGTLACELLADPSLCSHEDSVRRSACAPCAYSGRRAGD